MIPTSHADTAGRKVVLLHHPRIPAALALARDLVDPLARRGLTAEIRSVGGWIADVLEDVNDEAVIERTRQSVLEICRRFPVYG